MRRGSSKSGVTCRDSARAIARTRNGAEEVSERIAAVRRAALRYGREPDALAALLPELEKELAALEGAAEGAAALRAELARSDTASRVEGPPMLTDGRRKAGERLAREVGRELGALGMQRREALVEVPRTPRRRASGLDRVELVIRTNRARSRNRSARSRRGEASRSWLALKAARRRRLRPTLVFRRDHANVGGRLAP